MSPPSAQKQDTSSPRLGVNDWLNAALDALLEGGIEAVQITVLSRHLGVTRGSFYWHFESREGLLTALLTEWRSRNTGVMVDAISDAGTLDDAILALFSVWVDHSRFNSKLDQAIRDWARHDGAVLAAVKAEDDARVAAIAGLFERHGYTKTESFVRARVIYFTQISFYALNVEDDETLAERMSYLSAYFLCFTGREIDPDIAAAYRAANLKGSDHE